MKHVGDITNLSGHTLPPVDCVTGGSPCQDLSVAGRRKGLEGERSGLFMEQIRIVKEMRERDRRNGRTDDICRPRYMVWENVPGAFSSNEGKDFQAVLTEICRIAEPEAPDVPLPAKGKWSKAGCLYGVDGRWSIAWRVHDAQFWGVAQRRKRIALVADFGGLSAPEICFERSCMCWDYTEGKEERKGTARGAEGGVGATGNGLICLQGNGVGRSDTVGCGGRGWNDEGVSHTLNTVDLPIVYDGSRRHNYEPFGDVCETVLAHYGTGGGNSPLVLDVPITMNPRPMSMVCGNDKASTLGADDYKQPQVVLPVASSEDNDNLVRRLTPLECERLQGFPDGWTDIGDWVDSRGKAHTTSDSARYKALGNSIAVGYANNASGFWMWLMKRISAQYERRATLGSLFDGIGGFPLAWETYNGKGSALWASEIEEFPIAVTKLRFPEREENE